MMARPRDSKNFTVVNSTRTESQGEEAINRTAAAGHIVEIANRDAANVPHAPLSERKGHRDGEASCYWKLHKGDSSSEAGDDSRTQQV